MAHRIPICIANFLFWLSCIPNTVRFLLASRCVYSTQKRVLDRIIKKNRDTEFGRMHSFHTIHTYKEFQAQVPTRNYEDFMPFIDKIISGETRILTEEQVLLLEPTSGSTSASKLIPYTQGLKFDFHCGVDPWIFSLYLERPKLYFGSMYWSITPLRRDERYTESGIPIGFQGDGEYLNAIQKWTLGKIMAAPEEAQNIYDVDAFRYVTSLFLVARKDLKLISIWSPTYLSFLLRDLPLWLPRIVQDLKDRRISFPTGVNHEVKKALEKKIRISKGRVKELEDCITSDDDRRTLYERIWPELRVISAWQDGSAKDQAQEIHRMFPRVSIQPKGLLATEACVSFPLFGKQSVLSLRSHFFEFHRLDGEEGEDEKLCLAHELQTGKKYKVIVTTSGGLYRYELGDIIEVTGFFQSAPIVKFISRDGYRVVDLVGEKLTEWFVDNVVSTVFHEFQLAPRFWMIAPKVLDGQYGYTLFVELDRTVPIEELCDLRAGTDNALKKNYHYEYARRIGQLEEIELFAIDIENSKNTAGIYLEVSYRLGQRLSTIKQTRLHHYAHWSREFRGRFLEKTPRTSTNKS